MATVSGTFVFALPEDVNSDELRIYSSSTETGTYTLETTFNYTYGYRTQEYDSMDTTKWYKIQFYNDDDDEAGPLSDAVYGGDFNERSSPFMAISTSFDGANYASATDVYDITGLTIEDVSVATVRKYLRAARAYLDLRLSETDLWKFRRSFSQDIARRKFNAQLRIIKDCEAHLAASTIYRSLADNQMLNLIRGGTGSNTGAISIGSTTLSLDQKIPAAQFFDNLSQRYATTAASLFNSLLPATVKLHYSDTYEKGPLFMMPGEVGNIYVSQGNIGDTFVEYTAVLTGLGDDFNGAWYNLEDNAVVEGQASTSVDPLEASASVVDMYMTVNGVTYHLDDWKDNAGDTQSGSGGTTGGTDGFSIDFSVDPSYIAIKWNNTAAAGGFDLLATDVIELKYWVLGDS